MKVQEMTFVELLTLFNEMSYVQIYYDDAYYKFLRDRRLSAKKFMELFEQIGQEMNRRIDGVQPHNECTP